MTSRSRGTILGIQDMKSILSILLTAILLIPGVARELPQQTTFEFHVGIWVNLHHTLFNQALGIKAGRLPDLSPLSAPETNVWNQALQYYGQSLVNHDLLEPSMIRINRALALAGNSSDLKSAELSKDMARMLETAVPVYRAHWWADHDRSSRDWESHMTPGIAAYESSLKAALARAYDTPWPKDPIRVEISYYVPGNSAYTAVDPPLITISSGSQRNQIPSGLENIFHEAGHALVQKVFAEIAKDEKSQKKDPKYRDLWHALMFYTTGELVRKQVPELEPYATKYGLWETNWQQLLPIMEKDWKPFLEGKGTFKDAIKQLVADSPSR